jgi:hypothetical protein
MMVVAQTETVWHKYDKIWHEMRKRAAKAIWRL